MVRLRGGRDDNRLIPDKGGGHEKHRSAVGEPILKKSLLLRVSCGGPTFNSITAMFFVALPLSGIIPFMIMKNCACITCLQACLPVVVLDGYTFGCLLLFSASILTPFSFLGFRFIRLVASFSLFGRLF